MHRTARIPYRERLEDAALRVLEAKRGREAYRAPPPAAVATAKVLRPLTRDIGLTVAELQRRWVEIVGEKLAELTQPEKLSGAGAQKTLTLRAHPAAAPLVQHQTPLILDRLRLAGCDAAKIAVLQHAPAPKRPANVRPLARPLDPLVEQDILQALSEVEHGPLKAALARLGKAMQQSR